MIESIILGSIQGIFEWLPISSQGNLVLLMIGLFKIGAVEAFKYSVFLHLGTFLAVLVYFRKEIIDILKHLPKYSLGFKDKKSGLISFLVVSTLVTVVIGFPLYRAFSSFSFRGEVFLGLVGLALIVSGLLQRYSHRKKVKEERMLSFRDSLILGFFQGLAIIPGISRSGITVSAFLLKRYSPKQSLHLSFLMSIPVLFGGGIFLPLVDGLPDINIINLFLGLLFSFIFGLITIKILLELAKKIRFWLFCVVIGFLAFIPLIIYIL
ncbi:MAG: UDP-diphosphatase [Candidatus Portnoybacteria bacterium]|nr:UDP-diphosphatase [Candidatus Portnoybacteria bacterium]